jgi:hypothetical protein
MVIQDNTLSNTGTYDLTLLNVTSGPLSTGADPDGGAIASAGVKSGQVNADVDVDAFTFSGTAGDRVLIGAITSGGGTLNTTTTLYPPGGGAAEAISYGSDRLDAQLQLTGTYTIVVEDYGNNHPGNYSLTLLDLTSGPLTSGADADGGFLLPGDFKPCQFQTAPDFDAFRFGGAFGDTVRITTTPTSGPITPLISIYGPTGPALFTSGASPAVYVLPSLANFTLVLQDNTLLDTGSYTVAFQKTGGVTDAPGPVVPSELALAPAAPNPFSRSTVVEFTLPADQTVTLRVFDVHGRLVRTLADGRYPAGRHVVPWDGLDAGGSRAASGVYWAALRAGSEVLIRKMVRVQ